MPTRAGWTVVAAAVLIGIGGRLLGVRELYLLAASGPALVVGAVAYVRLWPIAVDARRRLASPRVPAGGSCLVELALTARGRLRTPLLEMVDGSRSRLVVAPLPPGQQVTASYRFPTPTRGRIPVGPLRVRLADPFGIAARSVEVLAPSTLLVHPRVDRIAPLPVVRRERAGPRGAGPAPLAELDSCALRPYEEGDDLRLVHWPTSARLDLLVVREEEASHPARLVVALDLRRSVHGRATAEAAISAAASLIVAGCAGDQLVQLATATGGLSACAGGVAHATALLDTLSGAGLDDGGGTAALANLAAGARGDILVVVTAAAGYRDLGELSRCPAFSRRAAVVFGAAGAKPPASAGMSFGRVAAVPYGTRFPAAWAHALTGSNR